MTAEKKSGQPREKFDFSATIQNLWQGRLPLKQVFWVYYVAVMLVIKLVGIVLPMFFVISALFQIIWAGFMVKPIFVAADKYKGPQHWALLAKVFAILLGFAVIGALLA